MRVYIYTPSRLLSSSSVFLLLLHKYYVRGLVAFPNSEKKERKKRFAAFFFLNVLLGFPTLIYFTLEKEFFSSLERT